MRLIDVDKLGLGEIYIVEGNGLHNINISHGTVDYYDETPVKEIEQYYKESCEIYEEIYHKCKAENKMLRQYLKKFE